MASLTMEQLKKIQQQASAKWISNKDLSKFIKDKWFNIISWWQWGSNPMWAKAPSGIWKWIDANIPNQPSTAKPPVTTTSQKPDPTKATLPSGIGKWIDTPLSTGWTEQSKFPSSISQQQYQSFVDRMKAVGKTEQDAKKTLESQWISVDSLWAGIIDWSNIASEEEANAAITGILDAKENQLQGDLKSQQDAINYITSESNVITNILQQWFEQQRQQLEELKNMTKGSQDNIAQIAEQRLQLAEQWASEVENKLEELRQRALWVFDEKVAQARAVRAQQLAEEWILTNEQAAQAAQYSLSDYTRDVRLQRAEIEQQMATEMVNAVKEKNALIDSIMQQQAVDENTKQQQVAQITNLYNNLLQNQAASLSELRARTSNQVLNMFTPTIDREAAVAQWDLTAELSEQERQRANTDPAFRTQYILDKTNESVDANLAPYILEYINDMKALWIFMQWDVTDVWSKLVSQARKQALVDQKA